MGDAGDMSGDDGRLPGSHQPFNNFYLAIEMRLQSIRTLQFQ